MPFCPLDVPLVFVVEPSRAAVSVTASRPIALQTLSGGPPIPATGASGRPLRRRRPVLLAGAHRRRRHGGDAGPPQRTRRLRDRPAARLGASAAARTARQPHRGSNPPPRAFRGECRMELICRRGRPPLSAKPSMPGAEAVYCGFRDETNARNFPRPQLLARGTRRSHRLCPSERRSDLRRAQTPSCAPDMKACGTRSADAVGSAQTAHPCGLRPNGPWSRRPIPSSGCTCRGSIRVQSGCGEFPGGGLRRKAGRAPAHAD